MKKIIIIICDLNITHDSFKSACGKPEQRSKTEHGSLSQSFNVLLFLFRSSKLWKQAHDRANGLNHRNSYTINQEASDYLELYIYNHQRTWQIIILLLYPWTNVEKLQRFATIFSFVLVKSQTKCSIVCFIH